MSQQTGDLCTMDHALKATLLGSEWTSSAGGLSTLNRELAIQLSQHTEARVSLLVPEGRCTDEDKREAQCYGISVVQAKKRPGYDALDWLSVPPKDHEMDVVVGHGVKLGRQVQIIKDSDRFQNCKWIQVVHTAPEDLSKHKGYSLPISKGEKKHEDEVDLCKLADLVVPIGPELKENYIPRLRRSKKVQDVFSLTPGLFEREFGNLEQVPNESAKFKVLLCGRCDDEDFELKGYNIAAKAFTDPHLKGKQYDLTFVGAPDEEKQEEVRQRFLQCGITNEQLTVRQFLKSRDKMKDLFCEVDLVIMPSKSEGFGLIALEALSAGLPILVSSRSGFAKAIESIPRGRSFVVDVDNPGEWAEKIEDVRVNHRVCLEEIKELRASYDEKYSWKEQCEQLVGKMRKLVNEPPTSGVKMPSGVTKSPKTGYKRQSSEPLRLKQRSVSQTYEEDVRTSSRELYPMRSKSISELSSCQGLHGDYWQKLPVEDEKTPETEEEDAFPIETPAQTASEGHISGSTSETGPQTVTVQLKITPERLNDEQQKIFDDVMRQLVLATETANNLSAEEGLGVFMSYLKESHNVLVKRFTNDGLEMIVECPTPGSLESLLNDYHSGHLREVAEACVVSDEIKKVFNVETVRLNTVIKEQSQLEPIRMASRQTVEDQGTSATWNNTGATSSAGSSPSQNRESTPGARWTPPNEGADAGQPGTKAANRRETEPPKHESRQRANDNIKPDVSCRTRTEMAKASRSALHKAAINGQYKTVKMLLGSGEDVDRRDEFSLTPLHLACWYGQENVASLLLEHGANANAVDRFHHTPMQKAGCHSHQSIVRLLLKNNARPTYHQPLSLKRLSQNAFLQVDRQLGFNLLQAAVYEGDYDIVFKASVILLGDFVKEMNSKAAVNDDHFFSGMNAVDILSCLDEKRQSHAKIDKLYQESVKKYKALTELHCCTCSDDAERAVELVLNDGVDPNIPALCNRTPLLWAIPSSSSMFVKTLIDLGADVNVQRTDDKVTPLGLAAHWNNYMNILQLLKHGADANVQDIDGTTPLCTAVQKGYENLVKLLLKNNADVNFQDSKGDSLLHFSVFGGSFEVSKLLIKAGCNISARNKSHKTPLYLAVEKNDEQLATLMLAHGADVHMQYNQDPTKRIYLVRGKDRGKSAWHYVLVEKFLLGLFLKRTQGGRLDVKHFGNVLKGGWGVDPPEGTIEKILEDGGDIFNEIPGETLLHAASRNNSTTIIQLLIDFLSRDLNSRDDESFTPLHIAAIHGNMQAVKMLVDLGADINQAIPVADVARINEEFEIEEYLKSKMAFKEGSGEREIVPDIARANSSTEGDGVESTLQRLRSIGNAIRTEGGVFLEAVVAAAFGSNRT